MPNNTATASIATTSQAFPPGTAVAPKIRAQLIRPDNSVAVWADVDVGAAATFANVADGTYRATAHRRHATTGAQVGQQAVSDPFSVDTQVYVDVPTAVTVTVA